MFKIEKSYYINKTFRLKSELIEKLYTIAQNKEVSLNNLVKQALEYAIKHMEE